MKWAWGDKPLWQAKVIKTLIDLKLALATGQAKIFRTRIKESLRYGVFKSDCSSICKYLLLKLSKHVDYTLIHDKDICCFVFVLDQHITSSWNKVVWKIKVNFKMWLFFVSFICYFATLYANNAWVDDFTLINILSLCSNIYWTIVRGLSIATEINKFTNVECLFLPWKSVYFWFESKCIAALIIQTFLAIHLMDAAGN